MNNAVHTGFLSRIAAILPRESENEKILDLQGRLIIAERSLAIANRNYADLNTKYQALLNLKSPLSEVLGEIILPKKTDGVTKYSCRKRTYSEDRFGGAYGPWGTWERISEDEYNRESMKPEYASIRQYRAQP